MKRFAFLLIIICVAGCGSSTRYISIAPDYQYRISEDDLLKLDHPLSFKILEITDNRVDTSRLFSTYRSSGKEITWKSSQPLEQVVRNALSAFLKKSGHKLTKNQPYDVGLQISILEFKVNSSTRVTGSEFASCRLSIRFIDSSTEETIHSNQYGTTSVGASPIGFESWVGYLEDALLDSIREIGNDFNLRAKLLKISAN